MIYVAESAKQKISEIRSSGHIADDYFVRVSVVSGGLDGKGFHFNNPNATRTCGCGESFAV
ncbi:MAG: hypothetical protein L6Q97_03640 [Thermoanaerobaculia bacterium]|nr:hypothetical protein [Thermoanaerobaculia bacterium]